VGRRLSPVQSGKVAASQWAAEAEEARSNKKPEARGREGQKTSGRIWPLFGLRAKRTDLRAEFCARSLLSALKTVVCSVHCRLWFAVCCTLVCAPQTVWRAPAEPSLYFLPHTFRALNKKAQENAPKASNSIRIPGPQFGRQFRSTFPPFDVLLFLFALWARHLLASERKRQLLELSNSFGPSLLPSSTSSWLLTMLTGH